jgi:hypothetical protein
LIKHSQNIRKSALLFYCWLRNLHINFYITFKTSTGNTLTQVNCNSFGKGWQDPSGMIWGQYKGYVSDQASAENVCALNKGTLPSISDYFRLTSYFDSSLQYDGSYKPTRSGLSEIDTVFPDMMEMKYRLHRLFAFSDATFPWAFSSAIGQAATYGPEESQPLFIAPAIRCVTTVQACNH